MTFTVFDAGGGVDSMCKIIENYIMDKIAEKDTIIVNWVNIISNQDNKKMRKS